MLVMVFVQDHLECPQSTGRDLGTTDQPSSPTHRKQTRTCTPPAEPAPVGSLYLRRVGPSVRMLGIEASTCLEFFF